MDLSYFGCVPEIAFKDLNGVYLDGKKIALDNASTNGYIRYATDMTFDPKSVCSGEYNVATDLIFVGAVPNCDEDSIYLKLMQAGGCNDAITSITFDKLKIAKSELITMEELSKFTDVTMVMMKYTLTEFMIFDSRCDYGLC